MLPKAISATGWLQPAVHVESPNFNQRPHNVAVDLLVVHNISLPPGQFGGGFIEQFFCNQLDCSAHEYFTQIQHLQVSAHCLIDRDGVVSQFVSFDDRAWHAGQSEFEGRANCNDFSVGIELEGTDESPYTELQYQTLTTISHLLMLRYPQLTPARVVGHCDIAPTRKTDPGPAFDWVKFRRLLSFRPN